MGKIFRCYSFGVSAINAKQIQVKFNQAIDKDTVVANDDTLVDGVLELSRLPVGTDVEKQVTIDDAIAELSGDGKTLTLTADASEYFEGTYAIAAKNSIRAANGDSLIAFSGTFVAPEDTTVPEVVDAVYNPATGKVKITMSEPVDINPTVTVDGGAPVVLTANDTNTEFTFDNTAAAGSNINVAVNGAVDYKGNEQTVAFKKTIKITYEESMIQVKSVEQTSSNEVTIVFDKSLAKSGSEAAAVAAITNGMTVLRGGVAQNFTADFDTDDDTNRTVVITFPNGTAPDYEIYPSGKNTATLSFVIGEETLTDIYGNTNAEITKSVTMNKDTVAPAISSVRLNTDKNAIEVLFNEDITNIDIANGLSVRKDGVVVTTAAGTEGFRAGDATVNGKLLVIPYKDNANADKEVPAGVYSVRLAADSISDDHNNTNAAIVSPNLSVANTNTTSDITVTSVANGANPNEYTVEFSGKVSDSALVASNYSLNGAALPTGTDIVFTDTDKDTVTIKLPDNSVNYSTATAPLRVVNVKDTDGYKVASFQDNVSVVDNVKPVLASASLVGNTLTLTYSENMDATIASAVGLDEILADLEIKGNAVTLEDLDAATDDLITSVDGKNVTFTITNTDEADNNWNIVKAASKITVKTIDGTIIKDANSTDQKDDVTVTVVKK